MFHTLSEAQDDQMCQDQVETELLGYHVQIVHLEPKEFSQIADSGFLRGLWCSSSYSDEHVFHTGAWNKPTD
jgi:hypothetical protein